jgi:hypothetical protein
MNSLDLLYLEKSSLESDINEHLPTFLKYAGECSIIVECGVREIVSSYAFAKGLVGNVNNKFTMIDMYKSNNMDPFLDLCHEHGVNASFIKSSDLTCDLIETDLLFIDTWHCYGQLLRELIYWESSVKKYIILHDTTSFEWIGEGEEEAERISSVTGMPIDEIKKGLWYAVSDFLRQNQNWVIGERRINNNGITVLKRIG